MQYTHKNNTYCTTSKDDPRDTVEIEVGDSKQPDFKPQVKLMRWNNEVNFSARLKDFTPKEISQNSLGVEADTDSKHIRFYELPESALLPEGGYEMQIDLDEKPASNVIEFSIQSKGLDFYYQPPLTEQEIADGAQRPENVVGSYAVYYKDHPVNYEGKKLYRTGKAFHIYRPRIEDSIGKWVWGGLNIENNRMIVTIPQEFLDTAVYPIRHVGGATFGYTSIGVSTYTTTANEYIGNVYASPSDMGTITKLTAYYKSNSGTQDTKGMIIINSSLNITTNGIGDENLDVSSSYGWRDLPYTTAPSVTASINYIFGYIVNGQIDIKYDATSGKTTKYDGSNNYTTPANLGAATTLSNSDMSLYITYTPSGGGATYIAPTKTLLGVGI